MSNQETINLLNQFEKTIKENTPHDPNGVTSYLYLTGWVSAVYRSVILDLELTETQQEILNKKLSSFM